MTRTGFKFLTVFPNPEIEKYMLLLPSGIPDNDDSWCNLRWWIMRNTNRVLEWETNPPNEVEEEKIYREFGRLVK